jgi:hypothetical protein
MARYRELHPNHRDPGRTPHEMIEESLLYGVERHTARAEKQLQQIDRDLGIDPEIGSLRRYHARCERETLLQLDGRGVAEHSDYMVGMRRLLESGDIRRKAAGKGYMITPQGRRRIKAMDAAVLRHFKNVREN